MSFTFDYKLKGANGAIPNKSWNGYVGQDTAKLSASSNGLGLGFSSVCYTNSLINTFITTMLTGNGDAKNPIDATFLPYWKAIGAAFDAGANTEAKATFGKFLGGFIDTGFKFGVSAKASGSAKVKVNVKPSIKIG